MTDAPAPARMPQIPAWVLIIMLGGGGTGLAAMANQPSSEVEDLKETVLQIQYNQMLICLKFELECKNG